MNYFLNFYAYFNDLVKENPFALALFSLLFFPLLKSLFIKTKDNLVEFIVNKTNKVGGVISEKRRKNIEYLIFHHMSEINEVEKLKNNDVVTLNKLLGELYNGIIEIFFYIVFFMVIHLIVTSFSLPTYIYFCFLGASIRYMFSSVYRLFNNGELFYKARGFDEFKLKRMKRIEKLAELLNT